MRAAAAAPPAIARVFQWTGALIFAASLGYFLYQYLTRFGVVDTAGDTTTALVWNTFAFTAFAFHHSLFAREPVRRWVRAHLPPDLERSLYVWIASLAFMAVCGMWRPVPGMAWDVSGPSLWVLWAVQAGGVWLTLRSAAILDIRVLAGITPVVNAAPQTVANSTPDVSPFRTTGPYGWVRHPIYSAWFLVVFSISPMTATRLSFAALSCVYLLVAIPFEERTMRATSGGWYERYMDQVRWRLVPGVY